MSYAGFSPSYKQPLKKKNISQRFIKNPSIRIKTYHVSNTHAKGQGDRCNFHRVVGL